MCGFDSCYPWTIFYEISPPQQQVIFKKNCLTDYFFLFSKSKQKVFFKKFFSKTFKKKLLKSIVRTTFTAILQTFFQFSKHKTFFYQKTLQQSVLKQRTGLLWISLISTRSQTGLNTLHSFFYYPQNLSRLPLNWKTFVHANLCNLRQLTTSLTFFWPKHSYQGFEGWHSTRRVGTFKKEETVGPFTHFSKRAALFRHTQIIFFYQQNFLTYYLTKKYSKKKKMFFWQQYYTDSKKTHSLFPKYWKILLKLPILIKKKIPLFKNDCFFKIVQKSIVCTQPYKNRTIKFENKQIFLTKQQDKKTYIQTPKRFLFHSKLDPTEDWFKNRFLTRYLFLEAAYKQSPKNEVMSPNQFFSKETKYFFESREHFCTTSNIVPSVFLKKKLYYTFASSGSKTQAPTYFLIWQFSLISRFLETCTGLKTSILLNPYLTNYLTLTDNARCFAWQIRVQNFQRILGARVIVTESIRITYLTLRLKDSTLLGNWLRRALKQVGFWKYKFLIRFIRFILENFFSPLYNELKVKGLKLKLKGKIGVAGNARTRTLLYKIGKTGQSRIQNKVSYSLTYLYTFTGMIGLQLWIYF